MRILKKCHFERPAYLQDMSVCNQSTVCLQGHWWGMRNINVQQLLTGLENVKWPKVLPTFSSYQL